MQTYWARRTSTAASLELRFAKAEKPAEVNLVSRRANSSWTAGATSAEKPRSAINLSALRASESNGGTPEPPTDSLWSDPAERRLNADTHFFAKPSLGSASK